MDKQTFLVMLEEQINKASTRITTGSEHVDEHAHGKLSYLLSLRRITQGKALPEDLGRHDAINDVLQALKIVDPTLTYLSFIRCS